MKKIHESKNVKLEVELDSNNSFDNIFGKLKYIIDGKDIATNKEENPTVATFYEECYHALQSLDNYPERGTVYANGGTIYDNVDLWEYDAKVRIIEEAEKLGISPKEVDKLNYQIEMVLKNKYGNY